MTTPVWAPGTLYQPGDLVRPRSSTGGASTQPDNPGFETGDLTDWELNKLDTDGSGAVVTGQACGSNNFFTGTHGFRWEAPPGGGGGPGPGGGWRAELINTLRAPVAPGQSITAQCYVRSVPCNRKHWTWGACRLYWFNESDDLIRVDEDPSPYGSGSSGFGTTGEWVLSSVTGVAPAGATRASIGAFFTTREDSENGSYADAFSWDYISPAASDALVFRAVQPAAGFSGAVEPAWPVVLGETVYDNEVIWEAVATSRVVWQATPILVSGSTEPDFPEQVGGSVVDNTIVWHAVSRRIDDERCPHSKIVAIAANKIFAGDTDIVAYSSTSNPLDWSSPNDAGYIPFGLNTYGANPVAALGLYRSNLIASSSSGYQMWQVDPNPANMAILDSQPVPFEYHQSLQPAANDLVGLTNQGIRSVGIAGASTNLQAGFFGIGVDPLVKPLLAAARLAGYDPIGVMWPAAGQYWCLFGDTAMVLTINGPAAKDMSWSRYVFPAEITDWTIDGTALLLRAGDLVWEMSEDALLAGAPADDVYCDVDTAPVLSNVRSGTTNNLSWTAVDGADHYLLYDADTDELIATVYGLTYPDAGLDENTDYTYYVVAVSASGGLSPHSNVVDGPIGGPAPPVLDGEVQSDFESILLSWTTATTTGGPITGYKIYNAADDSELFDTGDPDTLDHLFSGLSMDTIYSYYVTSYTAQTESSPSNTIVLDTGHPGVVIDIFTASGTWTKRSNLITVDLKVIAGGGGGGGGSTVIPDGYGGAGGGGGEKRVRTGIAAADLPSTVAVTVGAGGGGGAGAPQGGPRLPGTTGGDSIFAGFCTAKGGAGGSINNVPGNTPGNPGGTGGSGGTGYPGKAGGTFGIFNTPAGAGESSDSNGAPAGGGGGGGAPFNFNSAAGGNGSTAESPTPDGGAGGAYATAGQSGESSAAQDGGGGGGGGGGAVASTVGGADGGNGGDGGSYGAGGGGGGCSGAAGGSTSHSGGNGGSGAAGVVVVTNYLS
jgi:hypothetical protein